MLRKHFMLHIHHIFQETKLQVKCKVKNKLSSSPYVNKVPFSKSYLDLK